MGNNYLPTDYQNFIAISRYARWLPNEGRRENWGETVDRYMDNVITRDCSVYTELKDSILSLNIMPSMRMLMTAGAALDRDNICGYNCAYIAVDDPKVFDEAMYVSMNGTGVGFSVERQYINKMPDIPDVLFDSDTTILVRDSQKGWAKSFRMLIGTLAK
mgnify:FL=1